MACFAVTVAEAIVVTVATKRVKPASGKTSAEKNSGGLAKPAFPRKLKWLSNMLWGGSLLLGFEHITSGEVVPWFPFLTATATPEETSAMLFEMGTSGVAMAALVTLVWAGMVIVSDMIEKRPLSKEVLQ